MIEVVDRPSFERDGQDVEGTAIVFSGIQSTAYGQAIGLFPVLLPNHRKVVGYDYNTVSFWRPWRLFRDLADEVASHQSETGRVTIVGLSLGAFVAVAVTFLLGVTYGRDRVEDPDRYRVILIDPPFGADTMRGIPGWMAPIAHLLFTVLGAVTPAFMTMKKAESPTEEQLWKPNRRSIALMFPECDPVSYLERAREADVANQLGHSWRTWFQQLAYLTGGALQLPFYAMHGVKVDLITAEGNRNSVVRTGLAAPRWRERVAFRCDQNVHAEHAATLRHQPYYELAMRELFPTR